MKRLLSFLMAAVMLTAMVLPAAAATEPEITVELPEILEASSWCSHTVTNEETQEKWQYFNWCDGVALDATVNGELMEQVTVSMVMDRIYQLLSDTYGDLLSWYVIDGQTAQTPWQVGNTYPVEMGFYYYDEATGKEVTVWSKTMDVYVYDKPVSVEITTPIPANTADSELVFDEETQKEYIYYRWYESAGNINAVVNGVEYNNISFGNLKNAFAEQYGVEVHFGIADTQNTQPWTVGGTYQCTLWLITSGFLTNTVWEGQVSVTLSAPSVDMQITSALEIDALMGDLREDENGSFFRHYDVWEDGRLNAVVDGTVYQGVSLNQLRIALKEKYGEVSLFLSESYYGDPMKDPYEDPWKAGDEFLGMLSVRLDNTGELIYKDDLTIRVCETKISSASIAPITYYAYEGSAHPQITLTYKDGSTDTSSDYFYSYEESWPDTPGSYTMKFTVLGEFEVTVPVTVLENPTSGKLGDNVTWNYDKASETLTISGTGATAYYDQHIVDSSEEYNAWFDSWNDLLLTLLPKTVIVEEGIEYLNEGMFFYGFTIEALSLPSTLKQIPACLIGHNGSSADMDMGIAANGMSAFVVPENITSWNDCAFYYCWGITDIYLPAGLTELNLDNLCYIPWMRQLCEMSDQPLTIHFAGSEAQWNSISFVSDESKDDSIGTELSLQEQLEILQTLSVIFNDPADSYTDPVPPAIPSVNLRFKNASVVLKSDLTMNFLVRDTVQAQYDNIWVEFEMNGVRTVIEEGYMSGADMVFAFQGIAPRMIKDEISATIHGTFDGVEYTYTLVYSAYKNLSSLLNTEDPKLQTLLVDLLNYGAAHQAYMGYNTENMINADLTEEQKGWATTADPVVESITNAKYVTHASPTVTFKAPALKLSNAVEVVYTLNCSKVTDWDGVALKIEVEDSHTGNATFMVDAADFVYDANANTYKIYFKNLMARQMRCPIYVTVMKDGEAISHTVRYSVESYAYSQQNDTAVAGLADLLKAMIRYGDATYAYITG